MRTNGENIFLSASVQRAGHQLLDHQCWAFGGRDVLSSEVNLLCEFGFSQVRSPNGGMTQYEFENALGEDAHVYLWGFGSFFGNEKEGVFLGRNDFKPRRTLGRVELHRKEDPDFGDESSRADLFLQGIAWFADHEQWIARRMPPPIANSAWLNFPAKRCPDASLPHDGGCWPIVLSRIRMPGME